MLVSGEYDGIAIGYLFSRNNLYGQYALAQTRDSIGITGLSNTVTCRKFATDLRRGQGKEYMEFGWMDDGSLIIACRRLDPGGELGGLVLTGELLFYDKPEGFLGFGVGRLLRMMCLTEKKDLGCGFCKARGVEGCGCPPGWKGRGNGMGNGADVVGGADGLLGGDHVIPGQADVLQNCSEASTWSNYVQRVFSLRQSGSFTVRWWKAKGSPLVGPGSAGGGAGTNDLDFFIEVRRAISYDFVCGSDADTSALIGLYLAQREHHSQMCRNEARFALGGSSQELLMDVSSVHDMQNDSNNGDIVYDTSLPPTSYIKELQDSPISSARSSPRPDEVAVYDDMEEDECTNAVAEIVRSCGFGPTNIPEDDQGASSSLSSAELSRIVGGAPDAREEMSTDPKRTGQGRSLLAERKYSFPTSPEGRPMCPMCGRDFPKPGNVKRHIQTVHENQRPYRCDECGKRFGHKTHRDRHRKSHTPDLPYACQWCEARFRASSRLDRHVSSVHKVSNGSPTRDNEYICKQCGVAFAQKSNLNRHIASIHEHRRYVCSFCPQTFGQHFDMKRHVQRQHKQVAS